MTIPIAPGPFSFLEGAGEAAGSYAKVKEERKRHAETIAAAGIQTLITDILNGHKPAELLDDPNVRKMSKMAYGFELPTGIIPQTKEIIERRKAAAIEATPTDSAAGRAISGVPSEQVAAGAESVSTLAGAKAQSELNLGVPNAEAETKTAIARAQNEGAQLNMNIFNGARKLMGDDPRFARLAYEAATGQLDARLRAMEAHRADLSLDRQAMADRTRILLAEGHEAAKRYDAAIKAWEAGQQVYLLDHGDTPKTRAAYAAANPYPDQVKMADADFQNIFGYGVDEYRKRVNEGLEGVMPGGRTSGGARAGAAAPGQSAMPTRLEKITANAIKLPPEQAGKALADLVGSAGIVEEEARSIIAHLRATMPAEKFKKFQQAYDGGSK